MEWNGPYISQPSIIITVNLLLQQYQNIQREKNLLSNAKTCYLTRKHVMVLQSARSVIPGNENLGVRKYGDFSQFSNVTL